MFEDTNFGKELKRGDPDLLDQMIRENWRNWKSLARKHGTGKYGFEEGDAISIIGQALGEFLEDLNAGKDRKGNKIPTLTGDSYEVIRKKFRNKVQHVAKKQRDLDAGKFETGREKQKKQREKEKLERAAEGGEFGGTLEIDKAYDVTSTNVDGEPADMALNDSSSSTADTNFSKMELEERFHGLLSEGCRALFELKLIHEAALVKMIHKEKSNRLVPFIEIARSIATEIGQTVDNIRRLYWNCGSELPPKARRVFTNKERTRTLWDDWCEADDIKT